MSDNNPKTFAEKVLARAGGLDQAEAGQIVIVHPAHLLTHDNTAAIIGKIGDDLDQHGVVAPDFPVIVLDHTVPANSEKTATNHRKVREFVRRFGLENFFDVGEGICHQVVVERGLALPGTVIVGSDSHTCSYGAVGCFSTGIDRTEAAALLLTGKTWLKVPQSIRVELTGGFASGVTAKDLILSIIGELGADGASYRAVEFTGPALAQLGAEQRFTVANMGVEMGAKAAVFPVDGVAEAYLSSIGVEPGAYEALWADDGARYERELSFDLGALEPVVAMPHTVDNIAKVSEVKGLPIDQCLLGTCTNGRLSDLEAAARILRGKRIDPRVRMLVLPASRAVLEEAIKRGVIGDLLAAGATLLPAGCGPCLGAHQGVLAPGERCLSTANRNFKGRMGCREGEIVLASPETVAASALRGAITDPREEREGMRVWNYGTQDDINTDMLFPGKYTYTCSTADEVKPHLLEDLDESFAGKVAEGDVIFGGKNFGCGSSREQPVLGLRAVGLAAVVARSYARIFYRAAINQGLLLIECGEAVDAYKDGDEVTIDATAGTITVGAKTFAFPSLPAEILAIREAGGLLPYVRAQLAAKP